MSGRSRVLAATLAAASALSIHSMATADCAAPSLEVTTKDVSPGERLLVVGHSWGDACNDTPGPGCNPPPLGEPIQDVTILLKNKSTGETVEVALVDATDEYDFEVTITIPDLPPGKYVLIDARGEGYMVGRPLRID